MDQRLRGFDRHQMLTAHQLAKLVVAHPLDARKRSEHPRIGNVRKLQAMFGTVGPHAPRVPRGLVGIRQTSELRSDLSWNARFCFERQVIIDELISTQMSEAIRHRGG